MEEANDLDRAMVQLLRKVLTYDWADHPMIRGYAEAQAFYLDAAGRLKKFDAALGERVERLVIEEGVATLVDSDEAHALILKLRDLEEDLI